MDRPEEFIIANGVLKKYSGAGGEVSVPDGVNAIGDGAFLFCRSLTGVTLPEGVSSIGARAFEGCVSLGEATLPGSVTRIGRGAFRGCRSLRTFRMPEHPVDFDGGVFTDCPALADEAGMVVVNRVLHAYLGTGSTAAVPEGVTELNGDLHNGVFMGKSALRRVLLPSTLRRIRGCAFYGCTNLEEVTLPLAALQDQLFGSSGKTVVLTLTRPEGEPLRVVASFRRKQYGQTGTYPKDCLVPLTAEEAPYYDRLVAEGTFDGFTVSEPWRIRAALWRLADRTLPVAEEEKAAFADYLAARRNKVVRLSQEDREPEYLRILEECCGTEEKQEAAALQPAPEPEQNAVTEAEPDAAPEPEQDAAVEPQQDTAPAPEPATDDALLRDAASLDLGLDEEGKQIWDLGPGAVTVTLSPDLSLSIFDDSAGKPVRALPKKNAEPEKYEAAKAGLAELRRRVKAAGKEWADRLTEDCLLGRAVRGEDWREAYLKHPLLRGLARAVIWTQGGQTFILGENGPEDSGGRPVPLTEEPVLPADLRTSEEAEPWRADLEAHGLKPLIPQL